MPSLLNVLVFSVSVQQPGRDCKSARYRACKSLPVAGEHAKRATVNASVLLTFRDRTARQSDLGEHRRIVTERLVHVRDHLHDFTEQRTLAVIDDLGDEVGADRLAVGVKLDL